MRPSPRLAGAAAILAIVAGVGGGTAGCSTAAAEVAADRQVVVETSEGPRKFVVELADTAESRRRGLMYRTDLPDGTGMLFDFEKPRPVGMWMKNTLIPLDMLFIDSGGRVVHIEHEAEPHSLQVRGPRRPVLGVLEIAGGAADRLGIDLGDVVRHPMFERTRVTP